MPAVLLTSYPLGDLANTFVKPAMKTSKIPRQAREVLKIDAWQADVDGGSPAPQCKSHTPTFLCFCYAHSQFCSVGIHTMRI
jgi:hypothetical protein